MENGSFDRDLVKCVQRILENYKNSKYIFLDGKNFDANKTDNAEIRAITSMQIAAVIDHIKKTGETATKDEIFLFILDNIKFYGSCGYIVNDALRAALNLTYNPTSFRPTNPIAHHFALVLYRTLADRSYMKLLSEHRLKKLYQMDMPIEEYITREMREQKKTKAAIIADMKVDLANRRGPIELSKSDVKQLGLTEFETEALSYTKAFSDTEIQKPPVFDCISRHAMHYATKYRVEVYTGIYETVTPQMLENGYLHYNVPMMYVYGNGCRFLFFFSEDSNLVHDNRLSTRGWIIYQVNVKDFVDTIYELPEKPLCSFSDFVVNDGPIVLPATKCCGAKEWKILTLTFMRERYPNLSVKGNCCGKNIDVLNKLEKYEYVYVLDVGIDYAGLIITFSEDTSSKLCRVATAEGAFCACILCDEDTAIVDVMKKVELLLSLYFCDTEESIEEHSVINLVKTKKRKRDNNLKKLPKNKRSKH